MVSHLRKTLDQWNRETVANFLGPFRTTVSRFRSFAFRRFASRFSNTRRYVIPVARR